MRAAKPSPGRSPDSQAEGVCSYDASAHPPTALRALLAPTQEQSLGHGVAMAMGYLPLTAFAPVHLRGPQGVAARLTFDGGRRVLKAGGVGHVAHHVIRL